MNLQLWSEVISKSLEDEERFKAQDKELIERAYNLSLLEKEKEADFRPKGMLEEVSKTMQEGNQAPKDVTCAIMIGDQRKQLEFQRILKDAGASVRNWKTEELSKKGLKDIQK